MPSRREFLGHSLGAATTLALSSFLDAQEQKQVNFDPKVFIDEFPLACEVGAGSVERFPVEGATDVVVHIRQVHEDFSLPVRVVPIVEECQREIYRILLALHTHEGIQLKKVFNESTIEGKEKDYIDHYKEILRSHVKECLTPAVASLTYSPTQEEIEEGMKNFDLLQRKVNGLSIMGRVGAAEVLAIYKRIQLLGMENEVAKRNADRAKYNQFISEEQRIRAMYTVRDEAFLHIARRAQQRVHCVILGYGHNLQHKIGEWNAAATDVGETKFSLVTVSPQSVLDDEEYYRKQKQR